MTMRVLAVAAPLSAASALLAVRLASPYTIDDVPTAALLFVALPCVIILIAAIIRPRVGAIVAAALPAVVLFSFFSGNDPAWFWLVPLLAAAAILGATRRSRSFATSLLGGGAAAVAVVVLLLLRPPAPPATGTRAVLIGIDGASWQCVDAAVAAGRMPNTRALMGKGHRARLRSLPSMLSPQVWSAIATGCMPNVSGVYGWAASQRTFRVGRFWDRAWIDGRSVGTCGWYFTWPPPRGLTERDFVVPSTLAPDCTTVPAECGFFWNLWASQSGRGQSQTSIVSALLGALRSGVRLSTLRMGLETIMSSRSDPHGLESTWRKRRVSAAIQSDMFAELLRSRRPELGVALFNQVDKVSHLYWKYREPSLFRDVTPEEAARYGRAIEELYAEADRVVGKIIRAVPPDADIVIVSDHGFRPAVRKIMGGFCRIRTERLLDALDAGDDVIGSNLDDKLYIEIMEDEEERRRERATEIERALRSARIVGEDRPFFEVSRDDDLVIVTIAPRNAVPEDALIDIAGVSRPFDRLVDAMLEARFSGEHAPDGVFLHAGPLVPQSNGPDSLSVLDVAPTMAAILELPRCELWEGHAALDASIVGDPAVAEYPPPAALEEARHDGDAAHLKDVLRSLGYLD
ncbi:MAG: hypothetical protein GF405_01380 [Candidatus Eisenbacteria bacterium]|nr:hypothetical protein [Candidatus Eisenbacteria bacterium]